MRPANLILEAKEYFGDQYGDIRVNFAERVTGPGSIAKNLAPGDIAFDPTRFDQSAPPNAAPSSEVLVDGTIGGDEIDIYGINLVAGQTYLFSAYGAGADPLADTFLYVIDNTLTTLLGYDDDGGSSVNSLLTYTATYTGTHYIGVGAYPDSGLTGTYTLDAVVDPGVDVVSDSFALAPALAVGVTYGFIDEGAGPYGANFSEVDTYSITVEAGKIYFIEMAGGADYESDPFDLPAGELDPVLALYDSEGNLVFDADDNSFPNDISAGFGFIAQESGTYYLDALSWSPWTGGYSITLEEYDLDDFSPLDAINWFSADNVEFDETNTAYVYFAEAGESFGETADNGVDPLPSFGWNEFEKQQVMLALEQYEKILGVHYEITTDASQATFRLITTESEQYGAYFYPQDPAYGDAQGIGAFNILSGGWSFDEQQSLLQGGFAFGVILHEFGHAHGLAHPHDNGGGSDVMLGVTAATGSYGVFNLNQGVYTVMSYNDAWDFHPDGPSPFTAAGIDNGWSGTLSAFDIAVLQQRYGVVNPWATGNTTYTLRDVEDVGTYYETIWDTGGTDTIRYDGNRAAQIDLTAATLDYSPTGGGAMSFVDDIHGGYTIANTVVIENATGGGGNDVLIGNGAVNTLKGNGGDDWLMGKTGGDTLDGGLGFDTASYMLAAAGVKASLASNTGTAGEAAGDTFISIEKLEGSQFADQLDGGNGNDTLAGLGGNDVLRGANGNDTIDGGAGDDDIDGGEHNDTLAGGDGDDTVYGRNGNDSLTGGAGNDLLDGGEHNDTLAGGDGNNTLYGRNGNDVLTAGSGDDFLDGGEHNDTLTSGDGSDTLYGRNGNDVLDAGGGNDTLDGGEHNDTLIGGGGTDSLIGGNNNDSLSGGDGNDTLDGGQHNDTLNGGVGNDLLTGGQGNDVFLFTETGGSDRVLDFVKNQDKLNLAGIDAVAGGADNAFAFIGAAAFSGTAGQLRAYSSGGNYFVAGDVNGDGVADFTIQTNLLLAASDFVL